MYIYIYINQAKASNQSSTPSTITQLKPKP